MTVYSLPESSEYGGFTGGLTIIETKPPSGTWEYKLRDFIPAVPWEKRQPRGTRQLAASQFVRNLLREIQLCS